MENVILQKYIQAGNYRVFDSQSFPKGSIITADMPEIALIASQIAGNLIASSSSTEVIVSYGWVVRTGSFDFKELTSELIWGVLTASAAWCDELPKLRWNDRPFVKNVQLQSVDMLWDDSTLNKGIEGWSFNWPLLVTMYFHSKELRNNQCRDH